MILDYTICLYGEIFRSRSKIANKILNEKFHKHQSEFEFRSFTHV